MTQPIRRRRGLTEQAAAAAIDTACRQLRLPTVRDLSPTWSPSRRRNNSPTRGSSPSCSSPNATTGPDAAPSAGSRQPGSPGTSGWPTSISTPTRTSTRPPSTPWPAATSRSWCCVWAWMVAGLMFGLASKSKSASHLSRGNPAALTRRADGAPAGPVVAFGQQQLREEPLVGELFLLRDGDHVGDQVADGRQAQLPAGRVDRRGGGLLGQPSAAPGRPGAARAYRYRPWVRCRRPWMTSCARGPMRPHPTTRAHGQHGRVPSRSGWHRRVVRVSTGSAGIAVFP